MQTQAQNSQDDLAYYQPITHPIEPDEDALDEFYIEPPKAQRDTGGSDDLAQPNGELNGQGDALSALEAQREQNNVAPSKRYPEKTFSPNACLLYALEKTGHTHALPPNDPRRANPMSFQHASLQAILAKYILATADSKETSGFQLSIFRVETSYFQTEERNYLHSQGYDTDDLADWAALLMAKDVHVPATVLFGPQRKKQSWPPLFLLLFVLRRQTMQARTLQILVSYTWTLLQRREADLSAVDRSTVFIIFVRLLRHARLVWPEAVVNIARIISTYLRVPASNDDRGNTQDMTRHSRISALYNRTLSLLAEPVALHPFKSSVYQEIAQFDLLHAMASQRPPLRIGREGYEALTRVLLSRTKTERERDWTSLQAPSWPPWKRSKTGVDETKDLAYGSSRAAISLKRMVEAGYADGVWADIAKLYAGRDVDGSPVVQTRTLLPKPRWASADARVWEARIKTTRTVREAWACFLAHKESRAPPSQLVYSAMIVKLLVGNKQNAKTSKEEARSSDSHDGTADSQSHKVQPGDAIEPLPEPKYPGDLTYVPTEPPSPAELFSQMLDEGLEPKDALIAQMLRYARTVDDGLTLLDNAGPRYSPWLKLLASGDEVDPKALEDIPDRVFSAFILLLCRVPRSPLRLICTVRHPKGASPSGGRDWTLKRDSPPLHAMRLLFVRQSIKRQLWAAVLDALGDGLAQLTFGGRAESTEREAILKLQSMRRALAMMKRFGVEPDAACLMAVSVGVENAAIASHRVTRPDEASNRSTDWTTVVEDLSDLHLRGIALRPWRGETKAEAAQIETQAARFLRALFHGVVSGGEIGEAAASTPLDSDVSPIPRLLAIPSAGELHAYARALGVLGDHEGLWSLVQWMAEHHDALWVQVLEETGGKRRWLRLLTAIRVFLECPQHDRRIVEAGLSRKVRPADEELIALVRDKVNSMQDWNWPGKTLVWQYTAKRTGAVEKEKPRRPSITDYI